MEKLLLRNLYNARFAIGALATFNAVTWYSFMKPNLLYTVFGHDGSGGPMLKIITDLTDEEIARMKWQRRQSWHWKPQTQFKEAFEVISNAELSDRGLALQPEPYVEYMKRPPHDKYL